MKKCCFLLCLFLLAGLFAPPVCAQGETEMDEQTQQYYSDTLEQIRQLGEAVSYTHLDVYKRQALSRLWAAVPATLP